MRENKPQQVFGEECEFCPQTGRAFERGSGALSKDQQTRMFLEQMSPEQKAQRLAAANRLKAATPAGEA
jgi:hypothetical protein